MSYNLCTGHIPATFANKTAMESLDLSHNELSGPIPQELTRLWSLEIFSVAYNNLLGCIPNNGQFGTFSMDNYQDNKNFQNLSPWCSSDPSHIVPTPKYVGETPGYPFLFVISVTLFVLAFWAIVTFLFFHSYGYNSNNKLWHTHPTNHPHEKIRVILNSCGSLSILRFLYIFS